MFTMQEEPRVAEPVARAVEAIEETIAQGVLSLLGRPGGLHRVQVKPVSRDRYRVNVYVRADSSSYRVAHSYFVEADGAGAVIASSPAITRLY